MFNTLVTFFNAVLLQWKDAVIEVSTNGARNMTGRVSVIVNRVQMV